MLWEEVKKVSPDQWVVFEAIEAHSDNHYRIVDDIAVIDSFDDSMDAFRRHSKLHKQKTYHEFYFFIYQEKIWIPKKRCSIFYLIIVTVV
ncbi:hypothetical protein [Bacillus sp. SD088]|uniref:hypothetical protein n=1 Tax=Bacillus sp. SD088 TaxID=2782012 RepID=UPI001A95D91B|nr:hypothetical protein [Bacillus sp. SD088]MBO0993207.1 hypothetical protein [Bacillus sp. SD088]